MQAENAKLKQELEQREEGAEESDGRQDRAGESCASAGGERQPRRGFGKQSEEQLERTRAQMQELVDEVPRNRADAARRRKRPRRGQERSLRRRSASSRACVDRNAALYNLNAEVLDRMDNRGFWSSVCASASRSRKLKRVELENLIDDYKYRADELRLEQQRQSQAQAATPR